ncbi:Multiple RNA-binding domain-containing protein 1 [Dispira parvispora]|uniref:Multiple RNA-binding domain-containing protein 1 n=1 Tax=Dispira parvispora TaxID=1520584 RepID=A0A9W8E7M1_9FUNG|nr:Multiple RNA-binding domain-containing protein 1 [Dispira parvispora]
MSTRIIVKNLPKYLKDDRFREHFAATSEVTDCKLMKTPDGRSRKFGFIGYATEKAAKKAVAHFNNSFIDTSRINVEIAKPFNDPTLPRPWSSYSKGSTAYERRHNPDGTSGGTEGGSQFKVTEVGGQSTTEINDSKDHEGTSLYANTLKDPKFQEFAQVMMPRAKGKTWANDDLPQALQEAKIYDTDAGKARAMVKAVPHRKPGGEGMVVTKTHITFENSDDEYEDLPATIRDDTKLSPAADEDTTLDGDNENTTNNDMGGDDIVHDSTISDLDYLKARMGSGQLTELDKEANTVTHETESKTEVEDDASEDLHSASDSATVPEAGESPKDGVSTPLANGGIQPSNEVEEYGALNTKASDYNPQEIIMETGRLFLRNLPYTCTEEDIRKVFEPFGPLSEVHLPLDKETSKPKGFAYVLYLLPEHALAAFQELDAKFFQGRLLHILPAKEKITPKDVLETHAPKLRSGMSVVKLQRDAQRKRTGRQDFNWNSLYMSQDAVLESIAERLNVQKEDILDPSASNAAVRVALAETHVINETKQFLEEHGLVLDAFAKRERSETVILVKNIPYSTLEEELRTMFGKHGQLGRVLIPPARTMAVIEFLEAQEARSALRHLAYKKFKDSVIYLEMAPVGVFRTAYDKAVHGQVDKSTPVTTEPLLPTASPGGVDEPSPVDDPVTGATLFVKNISFDTTDQNLRRAFEAVPGLRSALIRRRDDPKRPGNTLSMGFGFVEYDSPETARKALRALQGVVVDGYSLQLKLSERGQATEITNSKPDTRAKPKGKKSAKLIIRNIPFEATKKDIRELFGNYGQIKSLRLPNKFTGGHRGFAFVEFLTAEEATRVMNSLANTHLYGRHLVIEYAEKDTTNLDELRERAEKDASKRLDPEVQQRKRRKVDDEME